MSDPNDQKNHAKKEVMRQEQFWFTATSLGFIGFVGALLKTPSLWDVRISLVLIWVLTGFTVYLVVGRHKEYCALDKQVLASWGGTLRHAIHERSGTLYCVVVVSFAAIGFTLIIFMGYLTPVLPTQTASSQTIPPSSPSVVAPLTIPISATSSPAQKP